MTRVHAFTDDALGDHDAVGLASELRSGRVSAAEVREAVAAGVVPIAHANDGGGSIRIPAAVCGLVGLKPGRGRMAPNANGARMPINLVADGVVSRSVRDTAVFLAAADRYRRDPAQPPLGLVEGPAARRLRIGLALDSPTGAAVDAETRATVEETTRVLDKLGHDVEPATIDLDRRFVEDFVDYWRMLAATVATGGRLAFGRSFRAAALDPFTRGLVAHLAHVTPELGRLSPTVPFDQLLQRLLAYVGFTPLNNVAGAPAMSLPGGVSAAGLPIGVHLSVAHGDERTLLELAYALEAERPWRRIQDQTAPN